MLIKEVIKENLLATALFVSVLLHTVFFLSTFNRHPEKPDPNPLEERLEIVLLSGGDHIRPDNAPVLAQIDSEGSGTVEKEERRTSPLPAEMELKTGQVRQALEQQKRRLTEIEAENKVLYTRMKENQAQIAESQPVNKTNPTPEQTHNQAQLTPLKLSQDFAEIDRRYHEYQQRPKKTQITPRSARAEYALYYKMVQEKIERVGTLNFPQKNGQKLYGDLVIYIPIFEDGTIYEKEGGISIKRRSGNDALDMAAVRVVKMAAPFTKLPANMRQKNATVGSEVWEIISTFSFTNQDRLQTSLRE